MKKINSEKELLNYLNVPSFRHVTKDKLLSFASILNNIDPEVAKQAIEQFPNFSENMKEIVQNYKEVIDKTILSNDNSQNNYIEICKSIIDSLKKELDKDNHSFEEKQYLIDKMCVLSDKIAAKDTENKIWLGKSNKSFQLIAAFAIFALSTAIGTTISIGNDNKN